MRRILPLRADRPLQHAADDLLGFERIVEGLADQVLATRDIGLVAGARAPLGGAGRSSFLNLLHEALLARGLAVLRLRGGFDSRLLRDATRLGQGAPIILIDDAAVAGCTELEVEAIVLVAWSVADGDAGEALSPLTIDLPPWDARAAGALARQLCASGARAEDAEHCEPAWATLLARASTPRQAWRLVQTAGAVLASNTSDASEAEIVATLSRSGSPNAPPTLEVASDAATREAAADDESEPARARCVQLARQGDAAAAGELAALLSDERAAIRLAAIQAFADLPSALALAHVRPLLSHADASCRRAAAHVLGRLGDQPSFDAIAGLLSDPSADVRRAASAAIGRLGGGRAISVLLPALDDSNAGLRMAAETALCQLLDELSADTASVGDEEQPLRETVSSLALIVASRHESARARALIALERLGLGSAADALAALLRASDERERESAASALLRAPGAMDALLPLLEEPDEEVARRAADLLGRLGDNRAVPALLRAHSNAAPSVRQASAASLVRLGFDT